MKIEVKITVTPVSKADFDRVTELIDNLWSLEQVVFDEYGDDEINFSVDEAENKGEGS